MTYRFDTRLSEVVHSLRPHWPCQRSTYETNGLLQLIIHSSHLDPACWAMCLQVEQSPREPWVINDRARVARVCLWLTQFDPHCLVTIVIGQPRSLWVTGRIPGATRWSAEWAWVSRGLGVENRRRCRLGFQMGIITRYSKEESLSHLLLYDLGGSLLPPPPCPIHLCLQDLSLCPSFAVGGTTDLLCPNEELYRLLSISSIFYKKLMPNPNMVPVQSIKIARLQRRKFWHRGFSLSFIVVSLRGGAEAINCLFPLYLLESTPGLIFCPHIYVFVVRPSQIHKARYLWCRCWRFAVVSVVESLDWPTEYVRECFSCWFHLSL